MKVEMNWVCLCAFLSKLGRLACPVPNQGRVSVIYRTCWFGMNLATNLKIWEAKHTRFLCCCLRGREGMWTTCWWLSLMRLVHLGIHRGLVRDMLSPGCKVVLSEGHDFFCCWQKKPMCLDDVRSGNEAVSTLWVRVRTRGFSQTTPRGFEIDLTERKQTPTERKVAFF